MNRSWKQWLVGDFTMRRLPRSLAEIYICILVWAWFFSDHVAFQPSAPTYSEESDVFLIATPSGHRIAILALTNSSARQVILYAHGNAEDLGGIRETMEEYQSKGFQVFAFDYQGYGISEGKPSTANSYEDINTVYCYLTHEKGIAPTQIIVHGRSLGAAIALHLAARQPVSGVIVESAFLTAFRARTQIPISPIDKMRNDKEIKKLTCPVLVIHGESDQTIKTWQGKKLFGLAHEPKLAYWVPNAGHDDVVALGGDEYWQRITDFARFLRNNN